MNLTSFNTNFIRIPLLSITLIALTNTTIAGGRNGHSLMSDFLLNKDSIIIDLSADSSIDVSGHALVFNRGALGVDNDDFDEKFSLAKTLTSILDSSGATTNNSNTQLLNSLLDTFNISSEAKISKHNINSKAVLQKRQRREERVYLSDMSPTAIFNRFDLSASNGEHCGEYRVAYHKNYGTRLFLIFEAQYPNPEPSKGKKGCFAVADFWQKIGQMSKADALVQLEKFFYRGLEHNGVKLPAVINFAHYTHGTGQVRSNSFVQSPWQLREFKTDINSQGEVVFVADTVKSNPIARLFANEGDSLDNGKSGPYSKTDVTDAIASVIREGSALFNSFANSIVDSFANKKNPISFFPPPVKDSDSLKALRARFNLDFAGYVDNLLAPERRAKNPSSSDIINGFSLDNDDSYNELQSDSSESNNTANGRNKDLSAIIKAKLTALNLSDYSVQMIRNRAEAMSCGGCHQNSNNAEIAPNVNWPMSGDFVHVDERGTLSPALTEQFLPARATILKDYLQKYKTLKKGEYRIYGADH
ncbi:hypothetical protein [uncultured Gammaproteobacteria bacterium]|nr:hypothetical protein [uncultured Gammaproteobacteria bacterium]